MPEPFDVVSGLWWRFTDYDLRDGHIRPAPGAALEQYDPWEDYRKARAGRKEKEAPYESLLRLFQGIRFSPSSEGQSYVLAPESEAPVQAWCERNGLLGILPQRAQMVVLAPRWEGPLVRIRLGDPEAREARTLRPTLHRYFRITTGWLGLPVQHDHELVDQPEQKDKVVPEEYVPQDWPRPSVLLQDLRTGQLAQEPLSQTWARFFPDVLEDERETFNYPLAKPEEFWRCYAEPHDDFMRAALALHDALWPLRRLNLKARLTEDEETDLEDVLRSLEVLVSPISPGLRRADEGPLRQTWRSPSLLATFAMMALQDLTEHRRVKTCEVCGRLLVTRSPEVKYCSPTCRRTQQKRAYREREAEKKRAQRQQEEGKEDTT